MKPLTNAEKAEIQAVTDAYAASLKTHRKGKYNFGGSPASDFANFSANPYVEDIGNPEAFYDGEDFAEYSVKAREVTSFGRIKSLVANSNMRESLKTFILSRNSQIRTANKIAEAKKDKKKSSVSKPSWY